MSGELRSSGDPYEYLRLTKAIEIIVDAAREIAALNSSESTASDGVTA
jgi:hypothetical protein